MNAPTIVFLLLLVDSLHYVFGRLLIPYLPPTTSALYIIAVGLVEVSLFNLARGGIHLRLFRRHALFFLSTGFLIAASTSLSFAAVAYIDPGTASLLAQTSVLFGLGFGVLWLKDRLNALETGGAVLARAGVFTISFQPGDYMRLGTLLVLGAALSYALHAALVKRYSVEMELAQFFLFRLASTTAFLVLFAGWNDGFIWPDGKTWLLLLLTGSVNVTLSRSLYYLALRRLQLSQHALILTLSPVVTILWSLAIFGTRPGLQQLIGGLGVMAGVLVVTASRARVRWSRRPQPAGTEN